MSKLEDIGSWVFLALVPVGMGAAGGGLGGAATVLGIEAVLALVFLVGALEPGGNGEDGR